MRRTNRTRHASIVAVMAAVAATLVLAACGGDGGSGSDSDAQPATAAEPSTQPASTSGAKSGGTIAIEFPNATQPVVAANLKQAKKRAAELGYELLINDPGNDLNNQVGVIRTWIQQKVDAIVAVAPEPEVFERVAAEARAAGIVWVTYAADLKSQNGSITWDQHEGGRQLGEKFVDWFKAQGSGSKAEIALLTFEQGEWARNIRSGIEDALKTGLSGNYDVVGTADALDGPTGTQTVSTLLQAHPDLSGVLCVSDAACQGAYEALRAKGHAADDPHLFVGGTDGSARSYELIMAPSFYQASASLSVPDVGNAMIDLPDKILKSKQDSSVSIKYTMLTRDTPDLVKQFLSEIK